MEDFINRTYTKKELGLMYFPESMPRTAVNHLMSWIRRCQPLWYDDVRRGFPIIFSSTIIPHFVICNSPDG
jgi:hypothetical protein